MDDDNVENDDNDNNADGTFCILQVSGWATCEKVLLQRSNCESSSIRLQRWSLFSNDGMEMFFLRSTIAYNGFLMVSLQPDHHHWMFFFPDWPLTLMVFQWFSKNAGAMVNDGFDP